MGSSGEPSVEEACPVSLNGILLRLPYRCQERIWWTYSITDFGYLAGEGSIARSAAFARSKAAAVPDWLAQGYARQ